MDFHCLLLTTSFLSVPSKMSLAEGQWKGGLAALLPFLGTRFFHTGCLCVSLFLLKALLCSKLSESCIYSVFAPWLAGA